MQIKELNFLQRKRGNYHLKQRTNNDFSFQRGINFTIPNSSKKIGNVKQKNESGNDRNYPQYSLINARVNSCKKSFGEYLDNSNSKENNKINIITDDKKTNLINKNSISNNSLEKKAKFNVINNISKKCSDKCSDKFSDKCPFDIDNNNEIEILNNKKAVYINKCLLNSYSTSRAIKKFKKNKFEVKKKNSSKYRGVSKNGNKWQVLIMINSKKSYIGSYLSEEIAARIYDILSIKNRGIKAKTNFIYNHIQIKKIIESKINIKSDNISDIIKKIIH